MEKSILILTLYDYYNYGTMLQAYALKEYINSLGFKVDMVNYRYKVSLSNRLYNLFLKAHHSIFAFKRSSKYYYRKKNLSNLNKRKAKFDRFKKNYIECGKQMNYYNDTICELDGEYDIYVVGSDQTWNPSLSTFSLDYFLSFVNRGKRIAYAPSVGVSKLSEEQKKIFKTYLNNFDFISCRELTGVNILKQCTDKKVYRVIDPTLLLNHERWEGFSKTKLKKKPYILEYFLGEDRSQREVVKEFALKNNLEIVNIGICDIDLMSNSTNCYAGPEEFISLIKDAAFVFTDSFHGTAFSLNLNTNFYVFYKKNLDGNFVEPSRISDFLDIFGLKNRIISTIDDINLNEKIDFSAVELILEKERKNSKDYLNLALGIGDSYGEY
ncbi:MAG: polysaccharide pyruvyl transferase family protein [Ruminococcus sp.]|nr:polysaccharide pyruvyl transferase family protein [Ruminococcus sp.]